MVKYPGLEELVAQTFVGLAPHRIFVHKSFQNLLNVLLTQQTITASQVYEKRADLEHLIVQVVWYVMRECRDK